MKSITSAFVSSLLLSQSALAEVNMPELAKEMDIMSTILTASLAQERDSKGIRVGQFKGRYLAQQGVMFEVSVHSSGRWHGMWEGIEHQIEDTIVSVDFHELAEEIADVQVEVVDLVPPEPPGLIEPADVQEILQDAGDFIEGLGHRLNDQLREVKDKQRELSWQQRDLTRRERDIKFEQKRAEKERRKVLEKELVKVQKEIQALKSQSSKVTQYAKEVQLQYKEKRAKVKAEKQKRMSQFTQKFETGIAEALCRYGNGLRSLPQKQYISFVLQGLHSEGHGKGRKEGIYVFNQQDVQACVQGKISAKKLMKTATNYTF